MMNSLKQLGQVFRTMNCACDIKQDLANLVAFLMGDLNLFSLDCCCNEFGYRI